MANVLGTLSSGVIIQEALMQVTKKRPIINRISKNLSNDKLRKGQSVTTRVFTVPAVNDFNSAAQDVAAVDVPVTLSGFKEVRHKFTAAEINATDRNLIQEAAAPIAEAIAKHIAAQLAALVTAANFPEEKEVNLADVAYGTVTSTRKHLNGKGAPESGRTLCINGDGYEKLLADEKIIAADKNSGSNAIQTGMVTNVAGLQIQEFTELPANAHDLYGWAQSPDALVMATAVPIDPKTILPNAPANGTMNYITHAETGLTVAVIEVVNYSDLSAEVIICWLEGYGKGRADSLVRLVPVAA